MLSFTSICHTSVEAPSKLAEGPCRRSLGYSSITRQSQMKGQEDDAIFALPGLVEESSVLSEGSAKSRSSISKRCSQSSSWPWIEGRNARQWSAHGLSVPSEISPQLELYTSSHTYLLDKERSIRGPIF
ncbi:hypothetical protein Vretimale_16805 [Volvox reticuliferus]|uniref:Uncharacterized protein n=1 Tax=Volvox reticuliferus TaxID=1737510 RepID=A0A8J4CVT7_9CHLO|nr:hypothetical protein Vretifemale_18506 [Volvox reticuliferus]GIM13776.1 hypothetical protein Vretimale_16805 [Volvox reticuliferus]